MAARCLCSTPPGVALNNHSSIPERSRGAVSHPIQLQKYRTVCAFNSGRFGRGHGGKLNIVRAVDDDDNRGDGGAGESSKGRQLWRMELLSNEFESLDDDVRQSATLERDIERLAKKEGVEKLLSQAADGRSKNQNPLDQRGGPIRDIADKVLVADFFWCQMMDRVLQCSLMHLGWSLESGALREALHCCRACSRETFKRLRFLKWLLGE